MTVQKIISVYNKDPYNKQNSQKSSRTFASMHVDNSNADIFLGKKVKSDKNQALLYKEEGNNFARYGKYEAAIESYNKSLEYNPDFTDARFNLAKSYKTTKDYANAIKHYEILLKKTPKDIEVLTSVAECYLGDKQENKAKEVIIKALAVDEKYDPARRLDKKIDNARLAYFSKSAANQQELIQKHNNMKAALKLACNYFTESKSTIDDIYDIKFEYDTTSSLSGHSNIAQYENSKRRIVVTNDYTWAAPEVVACYLVHEIVHGRDKDPYTSIAEEQDAYRESVKFWESSSTGIKDPEMDYALKLYNKSPEELDKKVAIVYATRDGSIPLNSPNHGMGAQSIQYVWLKAKDTFSRIIGLDSSLKSQAIISERKLLRNEYR